MELNIIKKCCLVLSLSWLSVAALPTMAVAEDSLSLIANESVSASDLVSKEELKRIYLGKTNTLSGQSVKPISLKEGMIEQNLFMSEVLGMQANEIKQYWIKESLKGGGRPPRSMSSSKSLISYIKKKPGTIGYLKSSDAKKSGLKVLDIE